MIPDSIGTDILLSHYGYPFDLPGFEFNFSGALFVFSNNYINNIYCFVN